VKLALPNTPLLKKQAKKQGKRGILGNFGPFLPIV
jgi:hypothetical protein